MILFTTMFCLDLGCYIVTGTGITSPITLIILQTDFSEAAEFIAGHGVSLLIIMMILAACSIVGVAKIDNRWKKSKLLSKVETGLSSNLSILICSVFAVASISSVILSISIYHIRYLNYWDRCSRISLLSAPSIYFIVVNDAIKEVMAYDGNAIALTNASVPAAVDTPSDTLSIVLIIGESHNKHRSNLYGYFMNTNPRMAAYSDSGSLVVFNDIISHSNVTREVIPYMLSTRSYTGTTPYAQSPLLPALMKKAGFHTSFFCNQTIISKEKGFDFSCFAFLSKSSIIRQCFDIISKRLYQYDGELVDDLPPSKSHLMNFYIYHLMGQHYLASERYPEEFNRFQPSHYSSLPCSSENQYKLMAEYDNACLYNDFVIDKIISYVKDSNSIVIYLSDHGEECYDYGGVFGRKYDCYVPATLKTSYQVPMWIWMSQTYMQKHPQVVAQLRKNVNKKLYNTDIAHTILDLAGIKTPAYRPECSLLADTVRTGHRPIGAHRRFDYDANRAAVDSIRLIYQ